MNKFLNDLEKQAIKHFSSDETKEVVSYYEEIINERLANGESIENIIASYDVNQIVKEMIPEIISKRKLKTGKDIGKSVWQLLLILFATPILIPLAILFIALMIVITAVGISGLSVLVAGVFSIVPFFIEVALYSNNIGTTLGLIGIGLFSWTLMIMVGIFLVKLTVELVKLIIKWFSNWIVKRKVKS